MTLLYFAYGSNMHAGRLRARVNSAVPLGVARLPEHELAFHKRGADGSGKANIVPVPGIEVWGVIYSVSVAHVAVLDAIEGPGYARSELCVIGEDSGDKVSVFSYQARAGAIVPALKPFNWYLDFLLHGAAHHGLPAQYVAQLQRVGAIADSDAERALRENALLYRP